MLAVILSLYKNCRADQLQQCLDSLTAQSYQNFDTYIRFDGLIPSECVDVVKSFQAKRAGTVLIHGTNSIGLAGSLNVLIREAIKPGIKYQFFARVDQDDICMKDRFQLQIDFLKNNIDVHVLGGSIIELRSSNEPGKIRIPPATTNEMKSNFGFRTPIFHPTAMIRYEIFREGNFYPESKSLPEDLHFWGILLGAGYKFKNIEKALVYYRVTRETALRRFSRQNAVDLLKFRLNCLRKFKVKNLNAWFLTLVRCAVCFLPNVIKNLIYDLLVK